eukprot:scaffold107675_cov24-Tisochrysis_lutea.AAC.1
MKGRFSGLQTLIASHRVVRHRYFAGALCFAFCLLPCPSPNIRCVGSTGAAQQVAHFCFALSPLISKNYCYRLSDGARADGSPLPATPPNGADPSHRSQSARKPPSPPSYLLSESRSRSTIHNPSQHRHNTTFLNQPFH